MKEIDNKTKEKRFRFPGRDFVGFGRKLSCVSQGGALWTAAQKEDHNGTTVVVARTKDGHTEYVERSAGPLYHRPVLVAASDGPPAMVWNQVENGIWSVQFAPLSAEPLAIGEPETVYTSDRLCEPPEGVIQAGTAFVAWSAIVGDRIRILTAVRGPNGWTDAQPLSGNDADAFRPTICATAGNVWLFWDEYRNNRYAIAGACYAEGGWTLLETAGHANERWFCPKAAATGAGDVYLTWVVMKEVADDRGIADHHPIAMVGRISDGRIEIMQDGTGHVIADLREGLLPSTISKGYLGLRRYPQLTVDASDCLWLCWEVRIEAENTAVSGHLAARAFDGAEWGAPRLLGNPGYGYALPPKQADAALSFGYFRFSETPLKIVAAGTVSIETGTPYAPDDSQWNHWHTFDIEPLKKSERTIDVDGVLHRMFWADTHCHTNVSADAEGEPDEIIHYARDIAGVDVLCLIDNDFYPNKTFSPAEWLMRGEYARHFTECGEFALFPGYEFTFHRQDLSPDFNHRTIMYPRPTGEMHRRIDSESDSDHKLLSALPDDAIIYPHHSSYELIDNTKERNVEICSSWRIVLEENDFTIRQLREGRKLGFIGSSDAHRANPGLGGALTGLFAPELTPEALHDAYRNRRLIATQGFAVFIDFRVAGLFIGSEGTSEGAPEITAEIEAPEPVEYVHVLRDGEEIHRETPGTEICSLAFSDDTATAGSHFYFLNLKLVGDPGYNLDPSRRSLAPFSTKSKFPHNMAKARAVFAWTSPVWVQVETFA